MGSGRFGGRAGLCAISLGILALLAGPARGQDLTNAAAARLTAAEEAFGAARMAFIGSSADAEEVYTWSVRWFEAAKAADPAGVEAALRAHLERMRWLEHEISQQVARGLMSDAAVYAAGFYLAEALYWIASAGYAP